MYVGLEKGWESIKKLNKEYLNGTLQKYQDKIIKRNSSHGALPPLRLQ